MQARSPVYPLPTGLPSAWATVICIHTAGAAKTLQGRRKPLSGTPLAKHPETPLYAVTWLLVRDVYRMTPAPAISPPDARRPTCPVWLRPTAGSRDRRSACPMLAVCRAPRHADPFACLSCADGLSSAWTTLICIYTAGAAKPLQGRRKPLSGTPLAEHPETPLQTPYRLACAQCLLHDPARACRPVRPSIIYGHAGSRLLA